MFLAFQGLRYYKKRRVPPRHTITQAAGRNHPVLCKMEPFTALHANSCRETAHSRMFMPPVFPIISLFPQPFLEDNIHLHAGPGLQERACAKRPTASRADRDWWIRSGSWHAPALQMVFRNKQWGDALRATGTWWTVTGDNCMSPWDAAAEGLL